MTSRVPLIDILKTVTPIGPTTRIVNTVRGKVYPPLSPDAQMTSQPLGLERFKETMDCVASLVA